MDVKGLSTQKAEELLKIYGKNMLEESKKITLLEQIFNQIKNPLILVLLVVVTISLLLKEYGDAAIIGIVLVFNTIIGIIYESRANNAINSLKQQLAPQCKVYRDGKIVILNAAELVPGDVVSVTSGDRIPADGELIFAQSLEINEAQLTGESFPVYKDEKEKNVFLGTLVVKGKGEFLVKNTGMETKLGEITNLVTNNERISTPIEKKFEILTKNILYIVLAICVGIFILGVSLGQELKTVFETSIAIALSAIPEGLPVVVTLTLSIGVFRMSRKNALLRNLASVSTLASVDVICTDKTGTITEGNIILDEIIENSDQKNSHLDPIELGVLCNDATLQIGDLLDISILKYAQRNNLNFEELRQKYKRLDEIPFDSSYMFQATLHTSANKNLLVVKGAPDVLIKKLNDKEKILDFIKNKNKVLGEKGKRIILICSKEISSTSIDQKDINKLNFEALLVFTDPLRLDVADAVERSKQSGLKTILITGDHPTTAKNIAISAKILNSSTTKNIITGKELKDFSEEDLKNKILDIDVIARADPMDKVRIIKAIQANGLTVAMTGDGVNDAPALVNADIGISMGENGTDAAREASDMVLLDNRYATIINGIEQARIVFENLRKTTSYLFMTSFGEILTIVLAIIIGLPLPVTAAQILWLNLITDGFLDVSIATEGKHGDLLRFKIAKYKENIVSKLMLFRIFYLGTIMALGSITFFYFNLQNHSLAVAQTSAFIILAIFQWLNAFNARSSDLSIFKIGWFTNKYLFAALGVVILLCIAAVYTPFLNLILGTVPVNLDIWIWALGFASIIIVAEELRKLVFHKFNLK